MGEPLKHIRRPNPPWRDDALTECGKPEADFTAVIDAAEAVVMWKKLGAQRAAFVMCMTCVSGVQRHSMHDHPAPTTWLLDPVAVMHRYLERCAWRRRTEERTRIEAELRAMGALIEAHRDEFDQYVEGLGNIPDLATARTRRQRRG